MSAQSRLRKTATRVIKRFGDDGALVLEFKIQTFSGDVEIDPVTTYGTGLFKRTARVRRDDAEDEHAFFDVAAGATDASGVLSGSPLVLNEGDLIVWQGRQVPIVKTGLLAATDPADPIAYTDLEAMTRANV